MNFNLRAIRACVWTLSLPLIALSQGLPSAFAADLLTLPEALAIAQQRSTLLPAQYPLCVPLKRWVLPQARDLNLP